MNKIIKNRMLVTFFALVLMVVPFSAFLFFHLEYNFLRIETPNPLLNRLIGGVYGLVFTSPGIIFGYKYRGYGFRK